VYGYGKPPPTTWTAHGLSAWSYHFQYDSMKLTLYVFSIGVINSLQILLWLVPESWYTLVVQNNLRSASYQLQGKPIVLLKITINSLIVKD
jgi:hypothetical protein